MLAAMNPPNPAPASAPPSRPNRHKMALLTLVGIYPTITAVLSVMLPILLPRFPLPIVTLIITAIVVPLMSYFIMPFLMRRFGPWLHR